MDQTTCEALEGLLLANAHAVRGFAGDMLSGERTNAELAYTLRRTTECLQDVLIIAQVRGQR